MCERQVRGGDFRDVDVGSGSPSAGRLRELTAGELTPNLSHRIADIRGRRWTTRCGHSSSSWCELEIRQPDRW